ncbi:4815_t:CDS:2 [Gigaspora margarita]|uniref:4815_t:CDS:1 n=1 Tax=Gigaspora margarita TaxID=4874 RepID=A0ABN7V2I4_GIGMA|nr:4815_t:CDS:2 [Gigaspora margarita]
MQDKFIEQEAGPLVDFFNSPKNDVLKESHQQTFTFRNKPTNSTTIAQNRKYCQRHRPDLKRMKETTIDDLKEQVEKLPESEREKIIKIWSLFSTSTPSCRHLILEGILAQCCLPQLSFISNRLQDIIRIDFIAALPKELAIHVLSYLDAISLCRAAQVCKLWRRLADDEVVWHKLCEQHIDKKCSKCGWGIPSLLEQKRSKNKASISNDIDPYLAYVTTTCSSTTLDLHYPSIDQSQPSSPSPTIPSTPNTPNYDSQDDSHRVRLSDDKISALFSDSSSYICDNSIRRPWKEVYAERQRVEFNWRKGRYNVKTLKGHVDGIMCLQFDDRKNRLITGSYDSTVRVWNLETGEVIRVLTGHTRCVRGLQFDHAKLITCSMDHTLRVWNYHTGKCITKLEGHTGGVLTLHFVDYIVASGSTDTTIKIWNFSSHRCFTLIGHREWVNKVVIFQKSQLLSCSDDHTIRIWDLTLQSCTRIFDGHNAPVQCIQPTYLHLNPITTLTTIDDDQPCNRNSRNDDNLTPVLISSSLDNVIKVWSLQTGDCIRTLFGHEEGVWSLAVDKLRLVSGAQDGVIKIWDKDSGNCMHTLTGHCGAVTCVALSDTKVITVGDDAEIRIWDFTGQ